MKKIAIILVIIVLLFAGCKTKEERLIIGEWKLVDVKMTLPTPPTSGYNIKWMWADCLYDDNIDVMFIFNKDKTFTFIKKDKLLDNTVVTGTYTVKNDIIFLWHSNGWVAGDFYDVIVGKRELIFKDYIYGSDLSDYFTCIFKKIK